MSECVETLNRWGENFCGFAWPMLWQSSLLIAVVFAFDWIFARRIRASVRCALWVVVLLKLVLPPSLALPTGATWWLWRAHPAVESPVIKNYTVSFDNTTLPDSLPSPTVPMVLPPPKFSGEARVLFAAGAMAAGLFLWLTFRWLCVANKVRRAATAPAELGGILDEARQLAGLRWRPRLRLIDGAQSPAVYGLLRPVILLPRTLANQMSIRQLRAVLLHESVHLRRGDIWMNCAQTLLQITYWWHPLLWLANARIRRLREEAVDDAVMLALRDGADAYAPTLLEVAKFAFRRPLASLGLVGILESRSALRQRVERLVDFRPPRRAGVTFLSLCGIFAFCAVALPMGQGPEQTAIPAANENVSHKSSRPWPDPNFKGIRMVYLTARFLILDAAQLRAAVPALAENAQPTLLSAAETKDYLTRLKQGGARCFHEGWEGGIAQAPVSGGYEYYEIGGGAADVAECEMLATNHIYEGWIFRTRATQPDWTPMNLTLHALMQRRGAQCSMDLTFPNTGAPGLRSEITIPGGDGLIWAANPPTASGKCQVILLTPTVQPQNMSETARDAINRKLNQIHLTVSYENQPLSKVLRDLWQQSRGFDPDKQGINFLYNPNVEAISPSQMRINPTTGLPIQAQGALGPVDDSRISINLTLSNVSLQDVLNAICLVSDHPIKYSVTDRGVVFFPKNPNDPQYEMRTFKVNPNIFYTNWENNIPSDAALNRVPDNGELARVFFTKLGVNLVPPKNVFYNDRLGILFVYAPPQDLSVIQKAIGYLSHDPPMLHIKARFIEVPQKFLSNTVTKSMFPGLTNGAILPNPDFQMFLHVIETQKGIEELAEPEVTTIGGRQTQMRATVIQPVITSYGFEEASADSTAGSAHPYEKFSDGSSIVPNIEQIETGPILDVVPSVLSDGYTIRLRTIASLIDFLGYASSKGLAPEYATNADGVRIKLPTTVPVCDVREASTEKLLYDRQTLVLFPEQELPSMRDEKARERVAEYIRKVGKSDKTLLTLVTITLIDAAGNPVHTDDELPFAQNGVPPQSP